MLITKTNPTGIDWYIQQLQTRLHNELVTEWELSDSDAYKCYGRCYRNIDKDNGGYVAEVYQSGKDYKEVYWDDTLTAISFFGMNGTVKKAVLSEAEVHLVFFADLSKLALKDKDETTIAHRADEELRTMTERIVGKYSNGFTLVSTELWLENVLREYPGSRRDGSSLKAKADMHPIHCFRLNLKLSYNPNKNC
jgi:hypothetical protein